MKDNKLKIYFLGSGRIGIPALQALLADDAFEVCGIGTQPDKPKGRKQRLHSTELGQWVEANGFKLDKIDNVNSPEWLERLQSLQLDFLVVIAFGQLLKEQVLNLPKINCINVHASILPHYRGASPIASCLLNGEEESGVSIMQMEKGLDTGPYYHIEKVSIDEDDTSLSLEDKLAEAAAVCLGGTLQKIAAGEVESQVQDHTVATHCRKISKSEAAINWHEDASVLHHKIQAFNPWPGAFFFLPTAKGKRRIVIASARPVSVESDCAPGTVLECEKELLVSCRSGQALRITRLIPEGKKEMKAEDFLRGARIEPSLRLSE